MGGIDTDIRCMGDQGSSKGHGGCVQFPVLRGEDPEHG